MTTEAPSAHETPEQTPERPETHTDPQMPSGGSPETHHEAALAKARAAALQQLQQDTGEAHPRWRLIATDSESLTGLAPTCTSERSNALHEITDYPGGPARDEHGVYDCCPWPQIETYSTAIAAYLVELLNADAEQQQGATA